MLTLSRPVSLLPAMTLEDVAALRDAEWEARERAYHETAIGELNALVRKYNGLAPYTVRRGYYALDVELDRGYRESAEDIFTGIQERLKAGAAGVAKPGTADWADEDGPATVQVDNSWPLIICLIGFKRLHNSHNGERLGQVCRYDCSHLVGCMSRPRSYYQCY